MTLLSRTPHPSPNLSALPIPILKNRSRRSLRIPHSSLIGLVPKTGPIKDLTTEGISPNPGPPPRRKKIIQAIEQTAKALFPVTKVVPKGNASVAVDAFHKQPSAAVHTNFQFRTTVPRQTNLKNGLRIVHTEYVTDLLSANTNQEYQAHRYNLNPGNSALFPWLSTIAPNYSQFHVNSITFHMKSTVSTATNGTCMIASSGDCIDPTPTVKSAFLQYENTVRCNAWADCSHVVPKDILKRLPSYFVSGVTGAAFDSTREMGVLFIASSGLPSHTQYSELYVSYDMTLTHPQPTTSSGACVLGDSTPNSNSVFDTVEIGPLGSNIAVANKNPQGNIDGTHLEIKHPGAMNLILFLQGNEFSTSSPIFRIKDSNNIDISFRVAFTPWRSAFNANHGVYTFNIQDAPNPWYIELTNYAAAYDNYSLIINPTNKVASTSDTTNSELVARITKLETILNEDSEYIVQELPHGPPALARETRSIRR